jgi:uncharacterized membrane protein YhaH (DUF805 family)
MPQPLTIDRAGYWKYLAVLMTGSLAMYAWGIYELVTLQLFPIVFGFIAPLILSTYLRVIAARRCRAIGWSPLLPWVSFSAVAGCVTVARLLAGHWPETIDDTIALSGKMVMLFSLADIKFLIIIGCKSDKGSPALDLAGRVPLGWVGTDTPSLGSANW